MFQILAPPRDLQPFIRFFWNARSDAHVASERIVPDGCCELIFHFGERPYRAGEPNGARQPQAFLFGQIERAIELHAPHGLDVLGVRFTPAGVAALWSLDVSALGPREWPLQDLFSTRERSRLERLRDFASDRRGVKPDGGLELKARCDVLCDWLRVTTRTARRPDVQRATAALYYMERAALDAASAARKANVSRRGLERAFRSAVGLSPGAYLRLRRVEACARELRRARSSLALIASEAGYADQGHFSREFREIVGVSPGAYRREFASPLLQE